MRNAVRKGIVSVILGCSLLFLLIWAITTNAQEKKASPTEIKDGEIGYQVVTVSDYHGVSPIRIKAKKGTTVIWLNGRQSPLNITFNGDQKVYTACKQPVNFVAGSDRSYVIDLDPQRSNGQPLFYREWKVSI